MIYIMIRVCCISGDSAPVLADFMLKMCSETRILSNCASVLGTKSQIVYQVIINEHNQVNICTESKYIQYLSCVFNAQVAVCKISEGSTSGDNSSNTAAQSAGFSCDMTLY